MKKISIIIPLYNLEGLIGKCIASALDQDLPPEEYEVIVVDDGSTDGSLAAAQRAARGHANVQVHAKPNEGVSMARSAPRADMSCTWMRTTTFRPAFSDG